MIAVVKIRPQPYYRREAFMAGLQACGYTIATEAEPRAKSDLLVLWNRQGGDEWQADQWEAKGGTVIVVENGYCGLDSAGIQHYAIAVHGHTGSGWFSQGEDDRFSPLGIQLMSWVQPGGYLLVIGQRGIGSRSMASPRGWEDRMATQLKSWGFNNIRIRRHPGRFMGPTSLDDDLGGASHCLIWSSACGVRALARGIPVSYCAPHWIASGAARRGTGSLDNPLQDDDARLAAFQRLAHAQWSVVEIARGEPFRRILASLDKASW